MAADLSTLNELQLIFEMDRCHSEAARLCIGAGMSTDDLRKMLALLNRTNGIGIQQGTRWTQANREAA